MEVYKAITKVQSRLATEGIGKNKTAQTYKFRGIDDVYNSLARELSDAGLCILPRVLSRSSVERQSKSGGAIFYTTVEVEFDFVSSIDGSKHTARTIGEAMDSSDKSTNKAMSAAYKYMAFMTFSIPTEGDGVDTEYADHRVLPKNGDDGIESIAEAIREKFSKGDIPAAYEEYARITDNDTKIAIWVNLKSSPEIRLAIKNHSESLKGN